MDNFEKIIKQIDQQDLKPKPKWYFNLKNLGFWTLFIGSILIGAIAFSIILYSIHQSDFLLLDHWGHSGTESILIMLPYLWLTLLFLFSIVAFFSFKKFKKAYKFNFASILSINFILSAVLGTILFLSNGSHLLDKAFNNTFQNYRSVEDYKKERWLNPDGGLLAGTVQSFDDETLTLVDFNNTSWTIDISNAFIAPILKLEENEKVKIVGKKVDNQIFKANEIRPWSGQGQKNRQRMKGNVH